jgi:ADP-ribose pyrophosphatase YjhB (NUDIX family)
MKISAGIIIKWKEKILLCHPTGKSWTNTFTPPKGGINPGEEIKDAAVRETLEETGITINSSQLVEEPILIEYHSEKNKIYKNVWLYTLVINELSEIGLTSDVVPKEQLQKEELDWAGFLSQEEAETKLFWRYKSIFR